MNSIQYTDKFTFYSNCVLSGKIQNLHLKPTCSVLRALPSQAHSDVQSKLAFLYLHFLMQPSKSFWTVDAVHLERAAQISRQHIIVDANLFNGHYDLGRSKYQSPRWRHNTKHHPDPQDKQHYAPTGSTPRPLRQATMHEMPIKTYISLMLHAQTRKTEIVDSLLHMGISISYNRLIIFVWLASSFWISSV